MHMIHRFSAAVFSLCPLLTLATGLAAHGGQYRGPGSVTPPPGKGAGSQPGRPQGSGHAPAPPVSGPSGQRAAVPLALGSVSSRAAAAGARRGTTLGVDLGQWQLWWEFNKDRFLQLKDSVHARPVAFASDGFGLGPVRGSDVESTLAPTKKEIRDLVLPALRHALETCQQRDVTSATLVALAKTGMNHPTFKVLPLLRARLRSHDQEIRETAALAMGITRMPEAADDLIALAEDSDRGRQLCSRAAVDFRTRAFAAHGLGLVGAGSMDLRLKKRIFASLAGLLRSQRERNLLVASIHGLRLLHERTGKTARERFLRLQTVEALWHYYHLDLGPDDQILQAHVPPAIGHLLGAGHGVDHERFKHAFAAELNDDLGRSNRMRQSAAIALGLLCEPSESHPEDAQYANLLMRYHRNGKDEQTRSFCLVALAEIGGVANRKILLGVLSHGSKAIVKPWAALALGCLGFAERKQTGHADPIIARALEHALEGLKNDRTQAAIAVALGLVGDQDAADRLRLLLVRNRHRDELAGYLCLGLALMGATEAKDDLRDVVAHAGRRPGLLRQAAVALGKLGDKSAAPLLLDQFALETQNLFTLGGLASALAAIGDRRTIVPLLKILKDPSRSDLERAFVAVALGGVADKDPLPFNAAIAENINYRAAVETLTDRVSGILDIL